MTAFEARIQALKQVYVPDASAIKNQRLYLLWIRKTDKFTVPKFVNRLKRINLLIAQFPGATTANCFTDNELKQIFYLSMPVRWRTNFVNLGQTLSTASFDSLKTYMLHQEQQTNTHCLKKSRDKNKARVIQDQAPMKVWKAINVNKKGNDHKRVHPHKAIQLARELIMMLIAPCMVAATHGGNAIKINAAKTSVHDATQPLM